jgi:hypothetical protein
MLHEILSKDDAKDVTALSKIRKENNAFWNFSIDNFIKD